MMGLKIKTMRNNRPKLDSTVIYADSGYSSIEEMQKEVLDRWRNKPHVLSIEKIANGVKIRFRGYSQCVTIT